MRPRWVLALLLALVAAVVVTGVVVRAGNADRRADTLAARHGAVAAARTALTRALSYKAASVRADIAAAKPLLTGAFARQYAELATRAIIPTATRSGVSVHTSVSAAGVSSATGHDRVEVLVFANQVTTTKAKSAPVVQGRRLLATMVRVGHAWRLAELTTV